MLAVSYENNWNVQRSEILHDRREHYARSALNNNRDDLDRARQVAEQRYREYVRRELFGNEIKDIHALVAELNQWKCQA